MDTRRTPLLKKGGITLLRLIQRAGQGQSPRLRLCDSTVPATGEHPALFMRIEGRRGGPGGVGRKTQKGKQNTTSLQVEVLMPIILLLTGIFELLEMEVSSSILICNHQL